MRTSQRVIGRLLGVLVLALALGQTSGCDDASGPSGNLEIRAGEWRTYGGSLARTFYNPHETTITRETASSLVPLWRFTAGAVVTASPILANVRLAGDDEDTLTLFVPSWDGVLYALRADDGSLAWSYTFKPHPGSSYPQAASASVDTRGGRDVVYIGSGMTMYALAAADGELLWEFDAGTGCTDCDALTERNEILSSAAVFEDTVYFGMDINDFGTGKGGLYAVDADRGTLRWFFDLETGATCFADPGDEIRRFDGYHTAAELGLPENFFATREGCDFDRTGTACGNVWSSVTIDVNRRLLYTASSNCDTDLDPETVAPEPPMPPFDAAIFAIDIDSARPAWRWRPRDVDNDDLAIGGVPNLFQIDIAGVRREVVGVGIKDGVYYVLDRDGTNEITGEVEPYWQTKVVPGGDIGGIIASAAVGEGKVLFSTAVGTDLTAPQAPHAWGLDAGSGGVLWSHPAVPSFGPTSAVPGVVFMGSTAGSIFGYDTETGERLVGLSVGGPASSPAVIVDGRLYTGAGTGARGGSPANIAFRVSLLPNVISAFCVAGTEGCPENGSCDDGSTCTDDSRGDDGACRNAPRPPGASCTTGVFTGTCQAGICVLDDALCDDLNQCTEDESNGSSCLFEPVPDGTPCVVRDDAGQCDSGVCRPL